LPIGTSPWPLWFILSSYKSSLFLLSLDAFKITARKRVLLFLGGRLECTCTRRNIAGIRSRIRKIHFTIPTLVKTSGGAPRSRAGGACEAPPHKNEKWLADPFQRRIYALYPHSRAVGYCNKINYKKYIIPI
jgi:hypothetical protein